MYTVKTGLDIESKLIKPTLPHGEGGKRTNVHFIQDKGNNCSLSQSWVKRKQSQSITYQRAKLKDPFDKVSQHKLHQVQSVKVESLLHQMLESMSVSFNQYGTHIRNYNNQVSSIAFNVTLFITLSLIIWGFIGSFNFVNKSELQGDLLNFVKYIEMWTFYITLILRSQLNSQNLKIFDPFKDRTYPQINVQSNIQIQMDNLMNHVYMAEGLGESNFNNNSKDNNDSDNNYQNQKNNNSGEKDDSRDANNELGENTIKNRNEKSNNSGDSYQKKKDKTNGDSINNSQLQNYQDPKNTSDYFNIQKSSYSQGSNKDYNDPDPDDDDQYFSQESIDRNLSYNDTTGEKGQKMSKGDGSPSSPSSSPNNTDKSAKDNINNASSQHNDVDKDFQGSTSDTNANSNNLNPNNIFKFLVNGNSPQDLEAFLGTKPDQSISQNGNLNDPLHGQSDNQEGNNRDKEDDKEKDDEQVQEKEHNQKGDSSSSSSSNIGYHIPSEHEETPDSEKTYLQYLQDEQRSYNAKARPAKNGKHKRMGDKLNFGEDPVNPTQYDMNQRRDLEKEGRELRQDNEFLENQVMSRYTKGRIDANVFRPIVSVGQQLDEYRRILGELGQDLEIGEIEDDLSIKDTLQDKVDQLGKELQTRREDLHEKEEQQERGEIDNDRESPEPSQQGKEQQTLQRQQKGEEQQQAQQGQGYASSSQGEGKIQDTSKPQKQDPQQLPFPRGQQLDQIQAHDQSPSKLGLDSQAGSSNQGVVPQRLQIQVPEASVQLYYYTLWPKCEIFFSVGGQFWESYVNDKHNNHGYQHFVFPERKEKDKRELPAVEFVITNDRIDWDRGEYGNNYTIPSMGYWLLQSGKIYPLPDTKHCLVIDIDRYEIDKDFKLSQLYISRTFLHVPVIGRSGRGYDQVSKEVDPLLLIQLDALVLSVGTEAYVKLDEQDENKKPYWEVKEYGSYLESDGKWQRGIVTDVCHQVINQFQQNLVFFRPQEEQRPYKVTLMCQNGHIDKVVDDINKRKGSYDIDFQISVLHSEHYSFIDIIPRKTSIAKSIEFAKKFFKGLKPDLFTYI